jgi:hypothetical protein
MPGRRIAHGCRSVIRILKIAYYALTGLALLTGITVGYNQLRIWQHSGQSYMTELWRIVLIFVFVFCFMAGGIAHVWALRIGRKPVPQTMPWKNKEFWRNKFSSADGERIRCEAELLKCSEIVAQLKEEKRELHTEIEALKEKIAPMSPQRLSVLKMIDELCIFAKKIPELPDADRSLLTRDGGLTDAYLADRAQNINLWTGAIGHEYAEKFSSRITAIVHNLGAIPLDVRELERYSQWVGTPENVDGVIQALRDLIWKIE